jgi:phosphoglycolate phosphatase
MTDYRLLIFDWDGTLMDSQARIVASLQQAASAVGAEVPSRLCCCNVIGLGLPEACRQLLPQADEALLAAYADAYRLHYLKEDGTGEALFAGAEAVLEQLAAAGYWLTVATGKSRRGLQRALTHTGQTRRFLATRCADECSSKPHPEMAVSLMNELGVQAAETLVIGDSEYDMLMAFNAGVDRLAVSYGVHEPGRLLKHAPIGVIDHIGELPELLAAKRSSAPPLPADRAAN